MRSIIIQGASTARGAHGGEAGGWAMQLERDAIISNKHHMTNPISVFNHSVPGITLPAINGTYDAIRALHRPRSDNSIIRILSADINEAKIMPGRERPIIGLKRFASELSIFAGHSLLMMAETIYVGPQPVDKKRTEPITETGAILEDDLLEEYADLVRRQAEFDCVPYVNVRQLFKPYELDTVLDDDGRHPNAFGHQLIYQAVRHELDELGVFA